ncbi:MAG: hypothetical protein R3315_12375, partial [Woeseiaceae bacterium]|nr:hypothetical protein [Woeseiaceae bacterium]
KRAPCEGDCFLEIKRRAAQRTEPFLKTVTGVRRDCHQQQIARETFAFGAAATSDESPVRDYLISR